MMKKTAYKYLTKKGFTFIEVLLAVSLFSLIGVALYSTFASALKIWEKSQRVVIEEDVTIFFDKLTQDLRNTFYYSQIRFLGKEQSLSFVTTLLTDADRRSSRSSEEVVDQIGRVEYYFDLTNKNVYRRQANYAQSLKEEFQPARQMLFNVTDIQFRYYFIGESDLLVHNFVEEVIPMSVEVKVVFEDEQFGRREMRRFINLPVGM